MHSQSLWLKAFKHRGALKISSELTASGKVPDTLLAGAWITKRVCGKFILCVMAHGLSKTPPLFWGSNAPQNVWTSCLGATLGFMPFGVGYFEVKNLRMSLASLVYGCGLNIVSRQCYRVGLLWEHAILNLRPNTRVNNTLARFSPAKSATHERH